MEAFWEFLKHLKMDPYKPSTTTPPKLYRHFLEKSQYQTKRNSNKEEDTPEESKVFLDRRQQYNQLTNLTWPQLFRETTMEKKKKIRTESNCRSMSARPADRRFPQQRRFQERRLRTKNFTDIKTMFMQVNELINFFTHI